MLVAFEINFALWGMIGCGLAELAQVVGYLVVREEWDFSRRQGIWRRE